MSQHDTPVLPPGDQEIVVPRADSSGDPKPLMIRMPVDVRSLALSVLAVLGTILVLRYAQALLIPIVLGILISYVLTPVVSALERIRVARAVGAGVAVALFVAAIGVGVYRLSDQALDIAASVPQAAQRIRERVRMHRHDGSGALQTVRRAATEIDRAAAEASAPEAGAPKGVTKVQVVDPAFRASDYLWSGGMGLVTLAGQFAMILFLVYFLLVTGDLYKRKLVKIAGPQISQKKITLQILDDINRQIERFIRVQVLTSLLVAFATCVTLWWFGLDHYVVWALLAGIFNSIPYLGPVIVTGGLGLVAFLQFNDVLWTLYVCGSAFAITSLEGMLLTPALMGRAAQMNPVAVFIGLLVWSWVWGVWGTVLAVPMLMMLKAICDHIEDLQPIGELLGE